MASLSVKQKALIFLNKYKALNPNDIYNTPWEVTQDGVANALCISRAHACIVLNQLRDEGNADERISHIKNGKTKRKVYYLTPTGIEGAAKLMEMAVNEGIDLDPILTTKKKKADIVLSSLSDGDRYALGCACAFTMPMYKDLLPPMANVSVPTDVDGRVVIDSELKEEILRSATDEERALWHGYAANYWFDRKLKNGDDYYECVHELLYHYVESGRNRDACKLISNEVYYLMNSICDSVHDSARKVVPMEKYAGYVLMLDISVCLEYDEIEDAEGYAKELKAIDSECASAYYFDIEMKKGNRDAAKAAIADTWQSYPMAGIRWASLLREEGRYAEARDILENTGFDYDSDLDNYQLEKFIELARLDVAEGHSQDALMRLSKARATVNSKFYNKKLNLMERDIKKKLGI